MMVSRLRTTIIFSNTHTSPSSIYLWDTWKASQNDTWVLTRLLSPIICLVIILSNPIVSLRDLIVTFILDVFYPYYKFFSNLWCTKPLKSSLPLTYYLLFFIFLFLPQSNLFLSNFETLRIYAYMILTRYFWFWNRSQFSSENEFIDFRLVTGCEKVSKSWCPLRSLVY